MSKDLLYGALIALAVHAGFAFGGDWFSHPSAPAPATEETPLVELVDLPSPEPEPVELPTADASSEPAGSLSDIVPPMQADTPAPTASTFVQRIQPPPPPGITRPAGPIIPVGQPGGVPGGTGAGLGLSNLFDLASLDQPPSIRVQVQPAYPSEMSRTGTNGEVVLGFIVDSEGNVRNPYVISSTHRDFEADALRAVVRWKFKPGRLNGANVSTKNVRLPFIFKIPDTAR